MASVSGAAETIFFRGDDYSGWGGIDFAAVASKAE